MLLLPILIIIIIGAYEVWKILYVRQTLNDAAYQQCDCSCCSLRMGYFYQHQCAGRELGASLCG